MKQLTKAEEQIMQALWETGPAFVKDIIEVMPEPKPHYNTVSTLVRNTDWKKGSSTLKLTVNHTSILPL